MLVRDVSHSGAQDRSLQTLPGGQASKASPLPLNPYFMRGLSSQGPSEQDQHPNAFTVPCSEGTGDEAAILVSATTPPPGGQEGPAGGKGQSSLQTADSNPSAFREKPSPVL